MGGVVTSEADRCIVGGSRWHSLFPEAAEIVRERRKDGAIGVGIDGEAIRAVARAGLSMNTLEQT